MFQPKNIFLTFDDEKMRVKIGDFGLSRHRLDATHSRPSTPVTPHPGVACPTPPADGPDLHESREFFTSGVGTTTYAAPEQLSGSSYDEKVKFGWKVETLILIRVFIFKSFESLTVTVCFPPYRIQLL